MVSKRRNVRLYDAAGNRIEFQRPFGFACDDGEEEAEPPAEVSDISREHWFDMECRRGKTARGEGIDG